MKDLDVNKKSLFQITQEYSQLINRLEELNGELTDELEVAIDLNKENLEYKTDGYYLWIEELELRKNKFLSLIDEAKKCVEFYDKQIEMFSNRMQTTLQTLGLKEARGNLGMFSLQKTKARVEILDESLIPASYVREKVTISLDKIELYNDLKSGKEIAGVTLVENYSLRRKLNNLKEIK